MIVYKCAKCRQELEVDPSLSGERVKCPHCENVEQIPHQARPATRAAREEDQGKKVFADRAVAMGLPPDSGPEVEVTRVHPVMFRARPLKGLGIVTLGLGGVAVAVLPHVLASAAGMPWLLWVGVAMVVGAAGWWGWWKLEAMCTRMIITNKRTTVRRGLLARSTREILHDQVKDLNLHQTILQRMLRTGSLGIDGSGTDEIELLVEGLPNPERLRRIIDAYREIG